MTGLRKTSLLALAFRPVKESQYHSSYDIRGGYYEAEISLPSGQQAISREYQDGSQELIPVLSVTLEMLGLKRLPSGKIVRNRNGGESPQ